MRPLGLGAAALLGVALTSELRLKRSSQPLSEAWRTAAVEPHGATRLGISVRSPQLDAFELDSVAAIEELLRYPFAIVRLGAYWSRIEPAPGVFDPSQLDHQVEVADRAGKQIIVCVGALKTFGYPEFFAPRHVVESLPEHARVRSIDHPDVLAGATEFIARIVDRYRGVGSIVAWQVEHESVDPLGFEHSWRLDAEFVRAETMAVREADDTRPVLMNGFLPVSLLGSLTQWLQTRDQGDSLHVAARLADIVGVDFYPRVGLFTLGPFTLYIDSSRSPWQFRRLSPMLRVRRRVMISEGQAEPWETVVIPPHGPLRTPSSCTPEQLIANYNACLTRARRVGHPLDAYLFWGAEYWLLRQRHGDPSYLQAFERVLTA
jgi:hypothetical protein